jgi:hypothetical protein
MPTRGQPFPEEPMMEENEPTQVFACALPPPELRRRRVEVLASVRARVRKVEETDAGFVFSFEDSPGLLGELEELVRFEAACCSFLEMRLAGGAGTIELTMNGPPGAKPFIQSEFVTLPSRAPGCGCG